ncbi:cysteine desulfurase family protein [Alkalibacter mobilis]|uniref:cysteine desulfurase family protein n=1 Tax=Alkalibacter mobilis TaxID=2787712 RepID=UPI00189D300F|nr:cysteine desulfurase family protein [Alkalibacter mobilis]MBF7095778.1 cysteine desulfurase [Alkalibacter mobilis]
MSRIYFDNSATTCVDDEAIDIMTMYHKDLYGNPSSLHRMGVEAEKAVEECRNKIAEMLSVKSKEIYFTSGGTEGNNMLIRGAVEKNKRIGNRIITSKIEHPSVLEVFRYYESQGLDVIYLDVDEYGKIDFKKLEESINGDTILVSIMMINNETGAIQDLKRIGELVKKNSKKTLFHSDCVQSFGKSVIDINSCNLDMLTFSAHKLHGPKGLGGVYIRQGLNLPPLILGGGQESGFRSGTENVASIAGFTKVLQNIDMKSNTDRFVSLKKYFISKVASAVDEVIINSPQRDDFADFIISISLKNVKGEILLHALEKKEIYVSTGSACSSKKNRTSHVLEAINIPRDYIEGTLRVSFSKHNTLNEIDKCIEALAEETSKIRKFTRRK